MNRREFLTGLLGSGLAIAIPCIPSMEEDITPSWLDAVESIFLKAQSDLIIFGQAALFYDDVWPFVHNCDPFKAPLNQNTSVIVRHS